MFPLYKDKERPTLCRLISRLSEDVIYRRNYINFLTETSRLFTHLMCIAPGALFHAKEVAEVLSVRDVVVLVLIVAGVVVELASHSWCFEHSQPQRIIRAVVVEVAVGTGCDGSSSW